MAEDFPEDKYDFKPTPAQRSFAEQLLHAANASYFFVNPVMGKKPPAEEDPKRAQFKSKAEIVAFVKKCFADGADAIKSKGDKGMSRTSLSIPSLTSRFASPTWPTAWSSTPANTTASSSCTTACQDWFHQNRVRRNNEEVKKPCHPVSNDVSWCQGGDKSASAADRLGEDEVPSKPSFVNPRFLSIPRAPNFSTNSLIR